jgi:hypothetical protein
VTTGDDLHALLHAAPTLEELTSAETAPRPGILPDAGDLMEQISTYVMAVAPGTDDAPEDPLAGGDNLFAAAQVSAPPAMSPDEVNGLLAGSWRTWRPNRVPPISRSPRSIRTLPCVAG